MAAKKKLSKDRVISAAIKLADKSGIDALSMRKIATRLRVEAMSLYHHVANKDEILDAMVDAVFSEINGWQRADWREALIARALRQREVMLAHPWALGLMDSRRNPGPVTLAHHNAVLGLLFDAGFSEVEAGHAYALIDSYVYGFVLQELALPAEEHNMKELSEEILRATAEAYPHLTRLQMALSETYRFSDEFAHGLEVVMAGINPRVESGR